MAANAVRFKRLSRRNRFPQLKRSVYAAMNPSGNIVHHVIRFASRKIKTIQRKAPKKPRHFKTDQNKTLYGYRATYSAKSKRFQAGFRRYQKKGLYSKPGSPPFWHGPRSANPFQTMRIVGTFDRKGYAQAWGNIFRKSGKVHDARVAGPAVRWNKRGGPPVPLLHEQGGVVRLGRGRGTTYQARNGADITRKVVGIARYAPRPFVGPGGRMGANEAWVKYAPKKLTRIAGMKPKTVVKMKRVA